MDWVGSSEMLEPRLIKYSIFWAIFGLIGCAHQAPPAAQLKVPVEEKIPEADLPVDTRAKPEFGEKIEGTSSATRLKMLKEVDANHKSNSCQFFSGGFGKVLSSVNGLGESMHNLQQERSNNTTRR